MPPAGLSRVYGLPLAGIILDGCLIGGAGKPLKQIPEQPEQDDKEDDGRDAAAAELFSAPGGYQRSKDVSHNPRLIVVNRSWAAGGFGDRASIWSSSGSKVKARSRSGCDDLRMSAGGWGWRKPRRCFERSGIRARKVEGLTLKELAACCML